MIKLAPPKGKTEPSFLWTGDRWQSACRSTVIAQGVSPIGPDLGCVKAWVRRRSLCVLLLDPVWAKLWLSPASCCVGQDYQYWSPLEFDDSGTGPALPRQQVWSNEVTLDIDAHPTA